MRSSRPAHHRIYFELEERITSGAWPVGTRLPPEPEIAAQLGVSRGTLRRALARLREQGLIDGLPGRGSFVRSASASRPERPRVVGVLVPSVARPFVGGLLAAVEDELHRLGYSMLVANSGATPEQEAGRTRRMLQAGIAGLVTYPIDRDGTKLYGSLHDDGIPLVFIDRYPVGLEADAVLSDNLGGAYQAVSHLAELGHRRIAFVATNNVTTTSVAERLEGYRVALSEHDIPYLGDLVTTELAMTAFSAPPSGRAMEEARHLIARFLEQSRPTAVFALHDRVAFEVHMVAGSLGLRVPQDLSLVGFDDATAVHAALPALTSVEQPRDRIGRLAAGLLVDRIEGRRQEVARHVLPTHLIVRGSTAPAAERPWARPVA